MNTNKIFRILTNIKTCMIVQLLVSIVFAYIVINTGMLPGLYIGILCGLLVLLNLGVLLFVYYDQKKDVGKTKNRIVKAISIVLSIVLIIGSIYVGKAYSVLEELTGANVQTSRYSVIVLNDDTYTHVKDLNGKPILMCNINDDKEHVEDAKDALEYKIKNLNVSNVDHYKDLAESLYNKEVSAIYINEGLMDYFEETYPTFTEDTKVLWTYDIEIKLEDFSKKVNVTEDAFTIYISGIDTRGPVSTVSRSDVNMLITINPYTKQILMTGIPRDYYVPMANSGIGDKLTHSAYDGIKNSIETIENFMKIDINYYARVNFTSVEQIVDALGGITVYSPVGFSANDGSYTYVAGDNYMDGAKALRFARERYNLPGGDNDRVANQQRVIMGILDKAMSPAIIKNYSEILDSIQGSFETNMSTKDITSFIQMQINDMASWDIERQQLVGQGTMMSGGAYYPYEKLYYMLPIEESVINASNNITSVVNDEIIQISE